MKSYILFYQKERNGVKFVYSIKACKKPERTKDYKKLLYWLINSDINTVGYILQDQAENQPGEYLYLNNHFLTLNFK